MWLWEVTSVRELPTATPPARLPERVDCRPSHINIATQLASFLGHPQTAPLCLCEPMKRWQDVGEVQDSDGEETGLSNDSQSQSPEHVRKKQRLDSPCTADKVPASAVDQDAEASWLLRKPPVTYGRKNRPARPQFADAKAASNDEQTSAQNPSEELPIAGNNNTVVSRDSEPVESLPPSSVDDLPSASQLLHFGRPPNSSELVEGVPCEDDDLSSGLSSPPSDSNDVLPPAGV